MQVQRYLVTYVYRRLPVRARSARQFGTFLVSAFWHGIRPGYYICFGFMFCMVRCDVYSVNDCRATQTVGLLSIGRCRAIARKSNQDIQNSDMYCGIKAVVNQDCYCHGEIGVILLNLALTPCQWLISCAVP